MTKEEAFQVLVKENRRKVQAAVEDFKKHSEEIDKKIKDILTAL